MINFSLALVVMILVSIIVIVWFWRKKTAELRLPIETASHAFQDTTEQAAQHAYDIANKISKSPAVHEVAKIADERVKRLLEIAHYLMRHYQVILGVTIGLTGMALVAVVYHFFENVVNLETSKPLEALSYAVFFISVTYGFFKHSRSENAEQKWIETLNQAEADHQEKLQKMKNEYDKLLDAEKMVLTSVQYSKDQQAIDLNSIISSQKKDITDLMIKLEKAASKFKGLNPLRKG
jgi:hypothetical protein